MWKGQLLLRGYDKLLWSASVLHVTGHATPTAGGMRHDDPYEVCSFWSLEHLTPAPQAQVKLIRALRRRKTYGNTNRQLHPVSRGRAARSWRVHRRAAPTKASTTRLALVLGRLGEAARGRLHKDRPHHAALSVALDAAFQRVAARLDRHEYPGGMIAATRTGREGAPTRAPRMLLQRVGCEVIAASWQTGCGT